MEGQLVLNMTVGKRILACKECGESAVKYGYCQEHLHLYFERIRDANYKRYGGQNRPVRHCKCGKELGFKKRLCPECAEASYKSKGINLELKAIRDEKKKEGRYDEGYFNPKEMTGIMIGFNEPSDYMAYKSEYGDFETSKVYQMQSNLVDLQHEFVKKVLRA